MNSLDRFRCFGEGVQLVSGSSYDETDQISQLTSPTWRILPQVKLEVSVPLGRGPEKAFNECPEFSFESNLVDPIKA